MTIGYVVMAFIAFVIVVAVCFAIAGLIIAGLEVYHEKSKIMGVLIVVLAFLIIFTITLFASYDDYHRGSECKPNAAANLLINKE